MTSAGSTILREEVLPGTCSAIGESLGFNPFYLRILFALGMISSPVLALVAYAALTALATFMRWRALEPAYQGMVSPR